MLQFHFKTASLLFYMTKTTPRLFNLSLMSSQNHPKIMVSQIFQNLEYIHGSSKVEIPSVLLLLLELSTLRVQYLLPIASFPSSTAAVELRHQKTEEAQPVRSASSRVNRVNSYAASNHGMIKI